MELTQLKYFQKIARTQSITQAALELNISQPTLSQSLRRLESSLGYPLFEHVPGRKLQLNKAGLLFLEQVNRALSELDQGVNAVREYCSISHAQVSLATAVQDLCSEIILSFYQKEPNVRISQRLVKILALPKLLVDEKIDFALSPCPLNEFDPRVEAIPLFTEEFFAIVGRNHPFYGRKTIHVRELIGQRFICNCSESDLGFLRKIVKPDATTGELNVLLQSNEPFMIKQMVECSNGVAFMPGRVVLRRFEDGDSLMQAPIRIVGYDQMVPTCICKKKNRPLSGVAADLYQHTVDYLTREDELMNYFIQKYFSD